MGYWTTAARLAWRETKVFTLFTVSPPIVAGLYMAWQEGGIAMNRWREASTVLVGSYSALVGLEFLYNLLFKAPLKLYDEATAEAERLRKELKDQLEPKLEILFGQGYPYDDKRTPGLTESGMPYSGDSGEGEH